jgi:hypothetical protein
MNYTKQEPSAEDNILKEPAVAYCPGVRAAEPWMASIADEEDDLDEFGEKPITAPDGGHWFDWAMKNSPAFREHFDRCIEESELAIKEGRVHTTEEVCDAIDRCLETGNWDEIFGDGA